MLHIKSLPSTISSRYSMITTSDNCIWDNRAIRLISLQHCPVSTTDIRGPGAYLRDFGIFDKFGNNKVENVQWKGTIFLPFTVNGVQSPSPHDGLRSSSTAHSLPPMLPSPLSYMVDVAPLDVSGYANDQYRHLYATSAHTTNANNDSVCAPLMIRLTVRTYGSWLVSLETPFWNDRAPFAFVAANKVRVALDKEVKAEAKTPAERYSWIQRNRERLHGIVVGLCKQAQTETRVWLRAQSSSGAKINATIQTTSDISGIIRLLSQSFAELISAHVWTKQDLSLHAREVVESINDFDGNALAFLSDLRDFGGSAKTILSLFGDTSPKSWASAWLSGRFGDRLSISDFHDLLASLKRALLRRQYYTRGRRSMVFSGARTTTSGFQVTYDHRRVSTIYVAPDSYSGIMTAVENLMRWDVWPTLENTWDAIPLSFVVDWFLPVSDLLSQIDAAIEVPYLKLISQYFSDRLAVRFSLPSNLGNGVVELVRYTRRPGNVCSDIRPFDVAPSLPSFSVVNAGDALALTVSLI